MPMKFAKELPASIATFVSKDRPLSPIDIVRSRDQEFSITREAMHPLVSCPLSIRNMKGIDDAQTFVERHPVLHVL